jgi:hypothetical protein
MSLNSTFFAWSLNLPRADLSQQSFCWPREAMAELLPYGCYSRYVTEPDKLVFSISSNDFNISPGR